MLLTFGIPLAFLALYLYSVSRSQPLSEAVYTKDFWIPIGLMGVMIAAQILFGVIGLVITVAILIFVARRRLV